MLVGVEVDELAITVDVAVGAGVAVGLVVGEVIDAIDVAVAVGVVVGAVVPEATVKVRPAGLQTGVAVACIPAAAGLLDGTAGVLAEYNFTAV